MKKYKKMKEFAKMKVASLVVIIFLTTLAIPKIISGETGFSEIQYKPITGFFILSGVRISIDLILFLISISTLILLLAYEVITGRYK